MGASIAVVGMGALSALGPGCAALARALGTGEDGLRPVRRFPMASFRAHLGGMVPAFDDPALAGGEMANRLCPRFATDAIREAIGSRVLPPRTLLIMGASQVDSAIPVHSLVEATKVALGFSGPALTVSTACSSSTAAIGLGVAALRGRVADAVIVGGADVLVPELYGGFDALGLLTLEKCAPFGTIFGTTLGEGAGFLVLVRQEDSGGPTPAILGYGLSCDAWHETSPHPHGEGLAIAMRAALGTAGVSDVAYVSAHGTGTEANDAAEVRAIEQVFGHVPPISSSKGVLGHAQAAAGSLEIITTFLGMEAGQYPPSVRASPARARMPSTVVTAPRTGAIPLALANSAAFGGANAVVVLGGSGCQSPDVDPHRVYWLGGAAAGRHGRGDVAGARHATLPALPDLPSLAGIRVDPRTLDPAGHLLTRAVADALADARVRPTRDTRDHIGLIGGAVNVSPSTHRTFQASIRDRGVGQPSVAAFARMVLNAPAGAAARALGLRGAHTLVSAGPGTGLACIVTAAMLLADDGPTHTLVAGAVDEEDEGGAYGAAAATLGRTPSNIRVAGWAVAADPEAAEREALERAQRGGPPSRPGGGGREPNGRRTPGSDDDVEVHVDYRDTPDFPVPLGALGHGPSVDGVHRCLLAVAALRSGARAALVVETGGLASFALVLIQEEPS
jgi:3-oxoacyl-[acyl-carrier-protein] synthase II